MKDPLFYKIVRPIIKGLFFILYRPKIIGQNNIPKDKAIILAGNHTNYFDCLFLISTTKRCIHFLAKHTLYQGIKKPLFKNMGIIPVNRSIKNKKAMESAEEILNNNGTIGIFPEGTINKTKDVVMPFKMGTVKMAQDTDCYIVPFAITGKYRLFNNHLKITFGQPYKISNKELEKENQKLMNQVSKLIMKGKEYGDN